MHRVLKPGGRVSVSVWCPLQDNVYFHTLVECISRHIGPDVAVGLKAAFGLTEPDEIRALLGAAHFKNVTLTMAQLELALPELTEFVLRHISATPMAVAFRAAAPATQGVVVQEVAERLAIFKTG